MLDKFFQFSIIKYSYVKLTPAETQSVYWAMRGKTTTEIAVILRNSPRTIEKHLASFRNKFDCERLSSAIKIAEQLGFIYDDIVFTKSFIFTKTRQT